MALYYELQVFNDVYTLVQKVFLYTQEFPREYKYTLGQDMKRDAIQLVRSIYRANKAKDKVVYLEAFLDDFELLKFEIRLCVDMKILAIKKQAERTSWSSNDAAGAFASPLKLPVAGRSSSSSDGSFSYVGSYGIYWSSTVSGTYASCLLFNSSHADMSSDYRAGGFSVRCLKD